MGVKVLAGRYEIFEKIGEGGMAVVYKARDKLLNRFVAIKILRPEYVKDTAFVESFRRESQAAAGLSHPNIVNVYDVGKEGNIHYIVMELVEGSTLSQIIKDKGHLDYKQTIEYGKQIASALTLAHKNHIIHRDVKPQNILVTETGIAKITDFGIAKAATDATIVTQPNTVMGSVHYFSPEQARGQYVDEKSDIYSLGIVLYEMITGRVPFDADNAVTIGIMHMNDAVTPPSQLVDGVPPGLEQIIMKATEKYQVNRFNSVEELQAALENVNFITGMIDDPRAAGYAKPAAAAAAGAAAANAFDEDNMDKVDADELDDDELDEDDLDEIKKNKKRQKKQKQKDKKAQKEAKKKANKPLRKFKVIAIILAIILAIPGSWLLYSGITKALEGRDVEVPDLKGMTIRQAEKALEEVDLQLKEESPVASDEYEKGEIVSQNPPGGEKVKKNTIVRVNVCSGEDGEVPYVIGMSKTEAQEAIEAAGYKVGTISTEDSTQKKDTVIDQDPEGGVKADADTKINLVLSNGEEKEEVSVPNLGGMTKSQAKKALEKVGLKLGSAGTASSTRYAKGQVMSQNPTAGTRLEKGKTVNVTISSGPASKSVAILIDFSGAPADENGNFIMTVTQQNADGTTKTLINGKQYNKNTGNTSVTATGTGNGKVIVTIGGSTYRVYNVNFDSGTYS